MQVRKSQVCPAGQGTEISHCSSGGSRKPLPQRADGREEKEGQEKSLQKEREEASLQEEKEGQEKSLQKEREEASLQEEKEGQEKEEKEVDPTPLVMEELCGAEEEDIRHCVSELQDGSPQPYRGTQDPRKQSVGVPQEESEEAEEEEPWPQSVSEPH